jgi:hypothetical protein
MGSVAFFVESKSPSRTAIHRCGSHQTTDGRLGSRLLGDPLQRGGRVGEGETMEKTKTSRTSEHPTNGDKQVNWRLTHDPLWTTPSRANEV